MLFSKINSKTSAIILTIFLLGSLFFIRNGFLGVEGEIDALILNQIAVGNAQLRGPLPKVNYIINFGQGSVVEEQLFLLKDSTVFSLLEDLALKNHFQIETTYYDKMGVLVNSIDKINNGIDNKYWQYWVNEELPMIAADKMMPNGGDSIEWKFAPISF